MRWQPPWSATAAWYVTMLASTSHITAAYSKSYSGVYWRSPPPSALFVNPTKRIAIFERFRAANPEPRGELVYRNAFELLVAVILSAQATDKSVNIATRQLFAAATTPAAILEVGAPGLEAFIKRIGLYRTKAKNILATCRLLIDQHGGEVPRTREELERLPGVGRKTANVVLNIAFGHATIAVDTHIFRVSNRTGLAPGKDVVAVEQKLMKLVPDQFKLHAHHWLILHGRYVCKARVPDCPVCIINDLCEYKQKTKPVRAISLHP
jgi:endonuclease III